MNNIIDMMIKNNEMISYEFVKDSLSSFCNIYLQSPNHFKVFNKTEEYRIFKLDDSNLLLIHSKIIKKIVSFLNELPPKPKTSFNICFEKGGILENWSI